MDLAQKMTCFEVSFGGIFHPDSIPMGKILSDRQVKGLFGSVIQGADEKLLNPNGIELRLGKKVKFISTSDEKDIPEGHFLKVGPGETVIISSLEEIDLRREAVEKHFQGCMLMAFITPTTTMVREGITQASTKVDAGYHGNLNWGFRNSSFKDFIMQQGESLFKLTFFLLEGDEVPDVCYGEKPEHKYQNTEGVKSSVRRLPVDIPARKMVASSFEKLDPKKQLREAGVPFSYIGSELVQLQGKWELVSTGVEALTTKLDETKNTLLDNVDTIFERKFTRVASLIVGAIPVLYGMLKFLQQSSLSSGAIAFLAILVGVAIPSLVWFSGRRGKK